MISEKNQTQYHFPGQNYTGPGTRITTNIVNRVKPTNKTDAVTLMHDVDYMLARNNRDALIADYKAIKNAPNNISGLATKAGLILRSVLMPGSFYGGNAEVGQILKDRIKNDPEWQIKMKQLDLSQEVKNW